VNLEAILYYFTHHSESIIQWLFFAILLLSAIVIARVIFGKKESEPAPPVNAAVFADGSDIQDFLKKILEQTTKLETVKLEGLSPAAVGEIEVQVQALKKDLAMREEELTKLKAAGGAGDAEKLNGRVKELETKLAEYEILEDDIADLSLYKEENVRLRSELDKLKGGTGEAAQPAAQPPGEDIVAEFAQAVTQDSVPAPASAPEIQLQDTGNPMADFESAVNLEMKFQGTETPAPAPAPAPAPMTAPAPAAPAPVATAAAATLVTAPPAEGAPDAEGDDLFAEFATAAPDAEGGSLDTDKMMEEMAALVSMEPSKGTALNEEIDTEKMAMEATRLAKS
jgi:hypothetical protein